MERSGDWLVVMFFLSLELRCLQGMQKGLGSKTGKLNKIIFLSPWMEFGLFRNVGVLCAVFDLAVGHLSQLKIEPCRRADKSINCCS